MIILSSRHDALAGSDTLVALAWGCTLVRKQQGNVEVVLPLQSCIDADNVTLFRQFTWDYVGGKRTVWPYVGSPYPPGSYDVSTWPPLPRRTRSSSTLAAVLISIRGPTL